MTPFSCTWYMKSLRTRTLSVFRICYSMSSQVISIIITCTIICTSSEIIMRSIIRSDIEFSVSILDKGSYCSIISFLIIRIISCKQIRACRRTSRISMIISPLIVITIRGLSCSYRSSSEIFILQSNSITLILRINSNKSFFYIMDYKFIISKGCSNTTDSKHC